MAESVRFGLIVGVPPDITPDIAMQIAAQLRERFPDHVVAVVPGSPTSFDFTWATIEPLGTQP